MGGETYYFAFSITVVVALVMQVINVACLKLTNKTIVGVENKPGQPGHEKFEKMLSKKGLLITVAIGIVVIANLAYDVYRLLNFSDSAYVDKILLYFPIAIVLFISVMLLVTRNKIKSENRNN